MFVLGRRHEEKRLCGRSNQRRLSTDILLGFWRGGPGSKRLLCFTHTPQLQHRREGASLAGFLSVGRMGMRSVER